MAEKLPSPPLKGIATKVVGESPDVSLEEKVIQRNYEKLVDDLDVESSVDLLFGRELITSETMERIDNATTRKGANRILIKDLLKGISPNRFSKFVSLLQESADKYKRPHHKTLADKLEEDLKTAHESEPSPSQLTTIEAKVKANPNQFLPPQFPPTGRPAARSPPSQLLLEPSPRMPLPMAPQVPGAFPPDVSFEEKVIQKNYLKLLDCLYVKDLVYRFCDGELITWDTMERINNATTRKDANRILIKDLLIGMSSNRFSKFVSLLRESADYDVLPRLKALADKLEGDLKTAHESEPSPSQLKTNEVKVKANPNQFLPPQFPPTGSPAVRGPPSQLLLGPSPRMPLPMAPQATGAFPPDVSFEEKVIYENYEKLVDDLDVKSSVDLLFGRELITCDTMDRIDNATTRKDANRILIKDLLKGMSSSRFSKFVSLFRESADEYKRPHHKTLADKLEGDLKTTHESEPSPSQLKTNEVKVKTAHESEPSPSQLTTNKVKVKDTSLHPTDSNSRFKVDFEPSEELGRGGFGVVYKCKHKMDGVNYAVKIIKLKDTGREKVMREVRALAQLDHAHIVRYFNSWEEMGDGADLLRIPTIEEDSEDIYSQDIDARNRDSPNMDKSNSESPISEFEQPPSNPEESSSDVVFEREESHPEKEDRECGLTSKGRKSSCHGNSTEVSKSTGSDRNSQARPPSFLYIQMQLCQKESLKEWLESNRSGRSRNTVMLFFDQILGAVCYVHSKGMMHRDLKPSNIFFSFDGSIKVGDFGLVAGDFDPPRSLPDGVSRSNSSKRRTGNVGTHLYMSPEQVQEDGFYDEKVDIFALGIILYEMNHPFATDMERANVLQSVKESKIPLEFAKRLHMEHELIVWLLNTSPSRRPSACEIASSEKFTKLKENVSSLSTKEELLPYL